VLLKTKANTMKDQRWSPQKGCNCLNKFCCFQNNIIHRLRKHITVQTQLHTVRLRTPFPYLNGKQQKLESVQLLQNKHYNCFLANKNSADTIHITGNEHIFINDFDFKVTCTSLDKEKL
jgi:hypothetical protein